MSRIEKIEVGDPLPERKMKNDILQSFMYNAALWNAHRIHYDLAYATEVEGYPGLVVAGPLLGDWLTQVVMEWLGDDGILLRFGYSNRKAAYLGDLLRVGGVVTAIDKSSAVAELDLYVRNQQDEVITPGTAAVSFVVAGD